MENVLEINRAMVASILTFHANDLRRRHFDLFPVPGNLRRIETKLNKSELLSLETPSFEIRTKNMHEKLKKRFPDLAKFLAFKPGHMVCAGGAVLKSMIISEKGQKSSDADIFFYDLKVEEAEKTIEEIVKWLEKNKKGLWMGMRNQHVTTIWILGENMIAELNNMHGNSREQQNLIKEHGAKYQFIHRVYPNKGSVIGGFDIYASMFMYDGFEFLGTLVSIFTLTTGYIIVDVSRRSPSFENRLKKYALSYCFGIIVPCRSSQSIRKNIEESPFIIRNESISFQVGGLLKAAYNSNLDYFTIRSSSMPLQQSDPSDYDAGEGCHRYLKTINTIMLINGKLDLVSWEGNTADSLFSFPQILSFSPQKTAINLESIDVYGRRDRSKLCRWVGKERTYNNNFKITAENYPDCVFDQYFNMKPNMGKYRNSSWPNLSVEEINVLCQVVFLRANKYIESVKERKKLEGRFVKWLGTNDNPGRQFTASFNPIDQGEKWYSKNISKVLYIGVPHETYVQLCLFQRYGNGVVKPFGRDILRLICLSLWKLEVSVGEKILKKVVLK